MDTISSQQHPVEGGNEPKQKVWILAFIFSFLALLVDGADIALLAYSLTSLKQEFSLSNMQAGALGSWTLAGMAIGGFFGGWACDRFGRVRVIVIAIALFSSLTFWLGFVESYDQFKWLRFTSAIGLGALYIACNTLMAEYVPTKYRSTVLATLMTGWTLGSVVATVLAGWLLPEFGWRYLYYIAIIPIVLAFAMYFLVPEPKAWLEARQARLDAKASGIVQEKQKNTFKMIFEDALSRRMFILWSFSTAFLQFGYYGVSNWLPAYLETDLGIKFKEMTMYMIGTFLIMMCTKVIAGFIADRIGRRAVFAFGTMGTAIFIPVIVFGNTPDNILWLMLFFGFLYGIPYGINATYMTESFSTKVRGTAVGGAYNVGRLGAVFAPLTIGYFAQGGSIGTGLLIMGIAYFLCGLIPAFFIKDRLFDPQKAD
ncbi:MFS transporter [Acinetobacter lwoffii]|uniref:MFS transporter n=1 Tax=Acinetobacter lwoffii TaxID=28090 RepID=UPI00209B8CF8|nr:MFS transporter [Acinetobacter lwoffii]MCO8061620.1 MFS transporter [Acinetobacter lwoffii]